MGPGNAPEHAPAAENASNRLTQIFPDNERGESFIQIARIAPRLGKSRCSYSGR
jgi:hypothetical protein